MDISKKILLKASILFNKDNKNNLARNAVTSTKLENIILNRQEIQKHNRIFSNKLDVVTKPTDQRRSGRCWLFALCNMLRIKMIDKLKLPPNFELSTNYLFFYHKLEMSNFFLHMIAKYRKEPTNSRMNNFFLKEPVRDGGNWNMILNLVNKYGVVPKDNFNESFSSENSNNLDNFLATKLRDYAFIIRNLRSSREIVTFIEKCIIEIYKILVIFLGEPPHTIQWEYMTDGVYKHLEKITPLDFYKKIINVNLDNYVLLSDNPTQKYFKNISIKHFNNMVNGKDINYINIPMSLMKEFIKKAIDGGEPLWFGCDVGKYLEKSAGILDVNILNYELVFNTKEKLDKKNRLHYCSSDVTHAMVLRGYDNLTNQKKCDEPKIKKNKRKTSVSKKLNYKKSNQPKKSKKNKKARTQHGGVEKLSKKKCIKISENPVSKYLVENSWGKSEIDENIVMTDSYMEEYFYIVAIPKKYLSRKVIGVTKQKPIVLNLWDPFGYLLF